MILNGRIDKIAEEGHIVYLSNIVRVATGICRLPERIVARVPEALGANKQVPHLFSLQIHVVTHLISADERSPPRVSVQHNNKRKPICDVVAVRHVNGCIA